MARRASKARWVKSRWKPHVIPSPVRRYIASGGTSCAQFKPRPQSRKALASSPANGIITASRLTILPPKLIVSGTADAGSSYDAESITAGAASNFFISVSLAGCSVLRNSLHFRIKLTGLGQQLVLAQVLLVQDDRANDAIGQLLVMAPQLGEQLVHGAAGAGAAAEHQNFFGAVQRFGDCFVKAFTFGLALAVGLVLNVVQVAAETIWII